MTEIRYADLSDYEMLLHRDSHIKADALKEAIRQKHVLLMFAGGHFAGWLRWNLFWDEIPFMNMLYFLKDYRGLGFVHSLLRSGKMKW